MDLSELQDMDPALLESILGTDYEAILASALRDKSKAQDRQYQNQPIGQVGDGQVFFDPFGAISNTVNSRRARKDVEKAERQFDDILAQQNRGKRSYIEALTGGPKAAMARHIEQGMEGPDAGAIEANTPMPQGNFANGSAPPPAPAPMPPAPQAPPVAPPPDAGMPPEPMDPKGPLGRGRRRAPSLNDPYILSLLSKLRPGERSY